MEQQARGSRGGRANARRSAMVMAALAAWMAHAIADDAPQVVAMAEAAGPRLSLVTPQPLPSSQIPAGGQDVGLQWRQAIGRAGHAIDIMAWRRMSGPSAPQPDALSLIQQRDPQYGGRVELRLTPDRGVVTDIKAIGMQLDGGGKLMLRRKNGGPQLYYRSQF